MIRKRISEILAGKKYFTKLLVLIMLISLVPLLFISFFSHQSNKKMVEQQITETSNNYLMQTVNGVEVIVNQINKIFRNFSASAELLKYEEFPNGRYFENISGNVNSDDANILYSYLKSKQEVIKLLYFLQNSNQYFHSAYLVDYSKDLVLSTEGTEYSIGEFKTLELGKLIKNIKEKELAVDNNVIELQDTTGRKKRVIPLVYYLKYNKNCLIINIDIDSMYENVLKNLDIHLENELIIGINSGRFLYDSNSSLTEKFLNSKELDKFYNDSSKNKLVDLSGNKIMLTKFKSPILGWTFFSIIKLDSLYSNLSKTNRFIFLITFLVLIITLVVGVLEAKRFYKPVNNLVMLVKSKIDNDETIMDEISVIENVLKKSFTQNEIMQERIEESLLASQERFVKLMLENQFTKREITEGLEYFNIDILPKNMMILLISANYLHSDFRIIEDKEFVKLSIIEMITGIIAEQFKGIVVEIKDGIFVAVFNCNMEDVASVYSLSNQIQSEVNKGFNMDCFVGIGNYCNDFSSVSRVYDDLFQAMRRRYISGRSKVFYTDDVRKSEDGILLYSIEDEKLLNEYIKSRDKENAKKVLHLMVSRVNSQKESSTFRIAQYTLIQILSNLIMVASEMGIDLEQCVKSKISLYAQVLEKNSIKMIAEWLEQLVDVIINNVTEEKVLQNNEYVVQVLNIINNNYTSDITLTSVADALGVNSSYLSRIFKENTGKTFMEYLTEVRMEYSKKLLAESDIKVDALSKQIGYSNSNYFIKIFRKYTGVTPGEFRKVNHV